MADRSPGGIVAAGSAPVTESPIGVSSFAPLRMAASPVWVPADITDDPAMYGVSSTSSGPVVPTTGQIWPR